jgi:molybdopterin converting factor small subunit
VIIDFHIHLSRPEHEHDRPAPRSLPAPERLPEDFRLAGLFARFAHSRNSRFSYWRTMKVNLRLGEPFWRAVGERNLVVELPDGATVGDLLTLLQGRYPALAAEMEEAAPQVVVGDEVAGTAVTLANDAAVYLLWPIAGG